MPILLHAPDLEEGAKQSSCNLETFYHLSHGNQLPWLFLLFLAFCLQIHYPGKCEISKMSPGVLNSRLPPNHWFSDFCFHWPSIWPFVSQFTGVLSTLSTSSLPASLESFCSAITSLYRSTWILLLKERTEKSRIFLLCWNQKRLWVWSGLSIA